MELASSESRINGRFDYLHPITCMIMGDVSQKPEKSPIQCEIVNISNGGLRIHAGKEIIKGSVMLVRIPAAGTEALVPTIASVKWVKKNCNGFNIGLKFMLE
jgi:hypothetical protein